MSDDKFRPFLIKRQEDGTYRLTVRDLRYNSQGYPLVSSIQHTEVFSTSASAKNFARTNFNAKAGEYATK